MKNKILVSVVAVLAFLLCISLVNAAVTVSTTYSESSPAFGSSTQEASNPDSDSDSDKNVYDPTDITFNNTGTAAVTITTVTVNAESGFSQTDSTSSGYINISATDADQTIAASSSEAITFQARIPEKLDAVDADGDAKAYKVASVTVTFSDASTASFDAYVQRRNKLELKKVEVTSEENDEKDVDDGDTVKELKPGEDVEVFVEAENTYDDSDNVDMEDVEVVVEINDGDMDVDEKDDISNLDPDENGDTTLTFDVENDVDEDTYDGYVYVTADDEHGARHGEKWDIDWKVERKSHEMLFKTASVSPDSLSCTQDRRVTITAKIENLGKSDEDETSMYVKSSTLGIDFAKEDFEVEEDDTYTKTFDVTIDEDLAAGTYPIRFTVYYSGDEDDGVQGDVEDVDLVIEECEEEEEEEEEESEPEVITTTSSGASSTPTTESSEAGVLETSETTFRDSTAYAVILVVALLTTIGAGIAIIVKLLIL